MADFDTAVDVLLSDEGGAYVPADHGRGPSRYGITLKTYQEFYPDATAADIAALGPEQAKAFYRRAFWERYHIGLIEDQSVATAVLDIGVNDGEGTVIQMLQRALGLEPDGILGPATAHAINARPPKLILGAMRQAAAEHYRAIVAEHPDYAGSLPGWLIRLQRVTA